MFDVCVIGHVTRDQNTVGGRRLPVQPGGVAYYAGLAHQRLGLRTAVITRVAATDEDHLLTELRDAGVEVFNHPSALSTEFKNVYATDDHNTRTQSLGSWAGTIEVAHCKAVRSALFHLGPLTEHDIDAAIPRYLASSQCNLALDAQGLVRRRSGNNLIRFSPVGLPHYFRSLNTLQFDCADLLSLTGARNQAEGIAALKPLGISELILTAGKDGATIFPDLGQETQIRTFPAEQEADATGCGDTFLAGYLRQRFRSQDLHACGLYAAAAASLAIEATGPLRASDTHVLDRMGSHSR